jgi:hypothetical protein
MSTYPELPVRLPEHLSDEAIAKRIESLYAFAEALENRYYAELQRHYQNNGNELEPGLPDPFPPF